jgi:hypothetical protein
MEQVFRHYMQFVSPLFFYTDDMDPDSVSRSGTLSYVKSETHCFAFTCYHVYEAYMNNLRNEPNLKLGIGMGNGQALCISNVRNGLDIIDESKDIDLITFDINKIVNIEDFGKFFFEYSYPIGEVQPDSQAIMVGFPENTRDAAKNGKALFAAGLHGSVTSSNRSQFAVLNNNNDLLLERFHWHSEIPKSLSGISGSAIYSYDPHNLNAYEAKLVGIQRSAEIKCDDNDNLQELWMFGTPLYMLQSDGTIDHGNYDYRQNMTTEF